MRPLTFSGTFGLALAILGACSEASTAPAHPPSAPTRAEVAAPPAPAAAPVALAPAEPASALALVRTAAILEAGGRAPIAPDGETVIDPAASFEVELGAVVPDVRLVLLDGHDAHVAAESARELGETTRLSVSPAAALVPGSRYVLRLEGLSARDLRDASGRAFAPFSFALLVAGTPPPPEPKKRPTRRR